MNKNRNDKGRASHGNNNYVSDEYNTARKSEKETKWKEKNEENKNGPHFCLEAKRKRPSNRLIDRGPYAFNASTYVLATGTN